MRQYVRPHSGGTNVRHGAPATSAPVDHTPRTGWGRTARRPRPGPAPARRGGLQSLERRQLVAVPLRLAGPAGLGMPGRRHRSQGPACRV